MQGKAWKVADNEMIIYDRMKGILGYTFDLPNRKINITKCAGDQEYWIALVRQMEGVLEKS